MNRKRHLEVLFKSFMCLLNKNWFLEDLVEIDYQRGLVLNKPLQEASEQRKNEHKDSLRKGTLERRIMLCRTLSLSFLWILLATVIAVVFALRNSVYIGDKFGGVISIFSFSWATLGRLGWQGQTIKGETVFEKLDLALFWFLYFMGTLLGVLSIITA